MEVIFESFYVYRRIKNSNTHATLILQWVSEYKKAFSSNKQRENNLKRFTNNVKFKLI